jgi:hypothetical protein
MKTDSSASIPRRASIRNGYLPQPLHRIACGVIGAAIGATIACAGLRCSEPDSSLQIASKVLLWLSVPIGIILACVAHRFSIVEGCAGDDGYDGLEASPENKGKGRD